MKSLYIKLTLLLFMMTNIYQAQANLPLQRDIVLEEANKSVVIGFHQKLHINQEASVAFAILAPEYTDNTDGKPRTRSAYVKYCQKYLLSNPGYSSEIIHAATEGDWVYLYTRSYASKKLVSKLSVEMYRVLNGYIVEHKSISKS